MYFYFCSHSKETIQEVREGPTYATNIEGQDVDVTTIPPPVPKPDPAGLDIEGTNFVFFDLETTGLGMVFLQYQILFFISPEPKWAIVITWRLSSGVCPQLPCVCSRGCNYVSPSILGRYIVFVSCVHPSVHIITTIQRGFSKTLGLILTKLHRINQHHA